MKSILNLYPYLEEVLSDSDQTGLRSQGKIYVVILVVALIFIGMIIYLATIDNRVRKLENKD